MTVYAELLKLALAEAEPEERSLEDLVEEVVALKHDLGGPGDAGDRLASALSYDVALAHLCESLGIPHELTGEAAGPVARGQAERNLAAVVPTLEATLR